MMKNAQEAWREPALNRVGATQEIDQFLAGTGRWLGAVGVAAQRLGGAATGLEFDLPDYWRQAVGAAWQRYASPSFERDARSASARFHDSLAGEIYSALEIARVLNQGVHRLPGRRAVIDMIALPSALQAAVFAAGVGKPSELPMELVWDIQFAVTQERMAVKLYDAVVKRILDLLAKQEEEQQNGGETEPQPQDGGSPALEQQVETESKAGEGQGAADEEQQEQPSAGDQGDGSSDDGDEESEETAGQNVGPGAAGDDGEGEPAEAASNTDEGQDEQQQPGNGKPKDAKSGWLQRPSFGSGNQAWAPHAVTPQVVEETDGDWPFDFDGAMRAVREIGPRPSNRVAIELIANAHLDLVAGARVQARQVRTAGRFVQPSLAGRLMVGNTRIFADDRLSRESPLAVAFLLDMSGSMAAYWPQCLRLMASIAHAFERGGAACLAYGFVTTGSVSYLAQFKGEGDPFDLARFSSESAAFGRGTCDGSALEYARRQLIELGRRRDYHKAIVIFGDEISEGPNPGGTAAGVYRHEPRGVTVANRALERCRQTGVAVMSVHRLVGAEAVKYEGYRPGYAHRIPFTVDSYKQRPAEDILADLVDKLAEIS